MAFYIGDFEKLCKTKEEVEEYLLNHYEGHDFDSSKEVSMLSAAQFDENMEPVGEYEELTVVIEPIMRWTAHDSERGEDYGVPTGRHNVYWG